MAADLRLNRAVEQPSQSICPLLALVGRIRALGEFPVQVLSKHFTTRRRGNQFVGPVLGKDGREQAPRGQHLVDRRPADDAVFDLVLAGCRFDRLHLNHGDGAVVVGPLEANKVGTERILAQVHPPARLLTVEADEQSRSRLGVLPVPAGRDQRGEKPLDAALVDLSALVRLDVEQAGIEKIAELPKQVIEFLVGDEGVVAASDVA